VGKRNLTKEPLSNAILNSPFFSSANLYVCSYMLLQYKIYLDMILGYAKRDRDDYSLHFAGTGILVVREETKRANSIIDGFIKQNTNGHVSKSLNKLEVIILTMFNAKARSVNRFIYALDSIFKKTMTIYSLSHINYVVSLCALMLDPLQPGKTDILKNNVFI
jgi:hypothetical protein